jgi:hypothetical protein
VLLLKETFCMDITVLVVVFAASTYVLTPPTAVAVKGAIAQE